MSTNERYHHGDLPNALRQAAVEVIGERGVGGFSLREVARRAGVSHAAPTHHFGDLRGLLTSIATQGFLALGETTAEAASLHRDPTEQLVAIGQAYVTLARTHPAHCAVMFRVDLINPEDEELRHAGLAAYDVLERTVQAVLTKARSNSELDVAARMYWSTIQGLVELELKFAEIDLERGTSPATADELVRTFTAIFVRGLRR